MDTKLGIAQSVRNFVNNFLDAFSEDANSKFQARAPARVSQRAIKQIVSTVTVILAALPYRKTKPAVCSWQSCGLQLGSRM
jgi:hypothetical protein